MTVKDFSGGLRLRPYDADISMLYGRKYYDIDHQRGSLIPLRQPLLLSPLTAQCLANADNRDGIEITSNRPIQSSYTKSGTVSYTLSWTYITNTHDFYQVNRSLERAGKNSYLVSVIYRFTNGHTYTKWSDEILVGMPENDVTTIKIGRPYCNEDLYNAGFKTCEVWVSRTNGDRIGSGDQNGTTKFDYTKLTELTSFNLKNGYKVSTKNIEFVSDKVKWTSNTITIDRTDIKPSPSFHKQVPYTVDYSDGDRGHIPLLMNSTQFTIAVWQDRVNGQLAHITSAYVQQYKVPSWVTRDWHTWYKFDDVKHYNGKYTGIYMWYDKGWVDIKDIPYSYGEARYLPSDTSPAQLYPADVKGTADYTSTITNEVNSPNNVKGRYALYGCKYIANTNPIKVEDILTNGDAFTYSTILDMFIPHSTTGSVIDFKSRVYYVDNDKAFAIDPLKGNWANMRLPLPSDEISININNVGNDSDIYTVKYRFTYYNSQYDIESPPSKIREVELKNSAVEITFSEALSGINADRLRVYRLSKGLIDYTLAVELPLNTSADFSQYKDLIVKENLDNIAGKLQLQSVTDTSIPKGIKYLTATNAIMIGAIKDKLYFSTRGKPSVWKRTDYIDFDSNITGIGAINNGIVVFTLNETYLIVGNSVNTFAKYLVSKEVGCIEHKTIQPFNNGLLFTSYDGIYYTQGSSITNVSDNLLGDLRLDSTKIMNAIVVNNQYHLALTTDDIFRSEYFKPLNIPVILVFDARFNKMFRMIREDAKWLGEKYRKIVALRQDNKIYDLYPLDTAYKEMLFESGVTTLGRFTEIKMFNDIYIAYDENIHLNIELLTKQKDKTHTIVNKPLPVGKRVEDLNTKGFIEGYAIIIKVNGNGKLHEIDFTAKGRSNGK